MMASKIGISRIGVHKIGRVLIGKSPEFRRAHPRPVLSVPDSSGSGSGGVSGKTVFDVAPYEGRLNVVIERDLQGHPLKITEINTETGTPRSILVLREDGTLKESRSLGVGYHKGDRSVYTQVLTAYDELGNKAREDSWGWDGYAKPSKTRVFSPEGDIISKVRHGEAPIVPPPRKGPEASSLDMAPGTLSAKETSPVVKKEEPRVVENPDLIGKRKVTATEVRNETLEGRPFLGIVRGKAVHGTTYGEGSKTFRSTAIVHDDTPDAIIRAFRNAYGSSKKSPELTPPDKTKQLGRFVEPPTSNILETIKKEQRDEAEVSNAISAMDGSLESRQSALTKKFQAARPKQFQKSPKYDDQMHAALAGLSSRQGSLAKSLQVKKEQQVYKQPKQKEQYGSEFSSVRTDRGSIGLSDDRRSRSLVANKKSTQGKGFLQPEDLASIGKGLGRFASKVIVPSVRGVAQIAALPATTQQKLFAKRYPEKWKAQVEQAKKYGINLDKIYSDLSPKASDVVQGGITLATLPIGGGLLGATGSKLLGGGSILIGGYFAQQTLRKIPTAGSRQEAFELLGEGAAEALPIFSSLVSGGRSAARVGSSVLGKRYFRMFELDPVLKYSVASRSKVLSPEKSLRLTREGASALEGASFEGKKPVDVVLPERTLVEKRVKLFLRKNLDVVLKGSRSFYAQALKKTEYSSSKDFDFSVPKGKGLERARSFSELIFGGKGRVGSMENPAGTVYQVRKGKKVFGEFLEEDIPSVKTGEGIRLSDINHEIFKKWFTSTEPTKTVGRGRVKDLPKLLEALDLFKHDVKGNPLVEEFVAWHAGEALPHIKGGVFKPKQMTPSVWEKLSGQFDKPIAFFGQDESISFFRKGSRDLIKLSESAGAKFVRFKDLPKKFRIPAGTREGAIKQTREYLGWVKKYHSGDVVPSAQAITSRTYKGEPTGTPEREWMVFGDIKGLKQTGFGYDPFAKVLGNPRIVNVITQGEKIPPLLKRIPENIKGIYQDVMIGRKQVKLSIQGILSKIRSNTRLTADEHSFVEQATTNPNNPVTKLIGSTIRKGQKISADLKAVYDRNTVVGKTLVRQPKKVLMDTAINTAMTADIFEGRFDTPRKKEIGFVSKQERSRDTIADRLVKQLEPKHSISKPVRNLRKVPEEYRTRPDRNFSRALDRAMGGERSVRRHERKRFVEQAVPREGFDRELNRGIDRLVEREPPREPPRRFVRPPRMIRRIERNRIRRSVERPPGRTTTSTRIDRGFDDFFGNVPKKPSKPLQLPSRKRKFRDRERGKGFRSSRPVRYTPGFAETVFGVVRKKKGRPVFGGLGFGLGESRPVVVGYDPFSGRTRSVRKVRRVKKRSGSALGRALDRLF